MSQIVASNLRISQRAPLPAMAALTLAACTLGMASSARAGEWAQRSCSYGPEYIFPEGWEGIEVNGYKNPNQDRPFDGCLGLDGGGGLDVEAAGSNGAKAGAGEMWVYTPPAESKIAGGLLTAQLTARNGDAQIAAQVKSGRVTLANCESPNCTTTDGFVPITASDATSLWEAAYCFADGEHDLCPSEGLFAAEAGITSAQILLSTNATPGASGFSGTLLNKTVTGSGTLDFTATDPGPGVYQARIKVDGQQLWAAAPSLNERKCVVTGTYEGARAFNFEQPCPHSTAVAAEADTTSLADGPHQLDVEVEDAAGNVATVYSGTMITANHPVSTETPPSTALVSPAPVRGPANGTPASESAALTAQWAGKSGKPSNALASTYGRPHQITGRLTTTTGAPIVDALIEVGQTPASLGAKASSLTGAHTNPQGNFLINTPPSSPSTSIQLVYRSHLGDATPVATRTLTLQLPASIHLTVSPHITSVGHTIVLRGQLAGPIPPGGKKVLFEARAPGGSWIEFHNATVDSHGQFRATHHFTFPGPVRYQFRVVCEREADFPFLTGTSNVVRVLER